MHLIEDVRQDAISHGAENRDRCVGGMPWKPEQSKRRSLPETRETPLQSHLTTCAVTERQFSSLLR